MKTKSIALVGILLSLASAPLVDASSGSRRPSVPDSLAVPAGHKVSFRAQAVGAQIYTAVSSPSNPAQIVWTFTGPEAVLFDEDGDIVGIHYAYAGPTRPAWQSESGSVVVAARLAPPVTVEANAIPWLLLQAVQNEGAGKFKNTTYIQRINTTGGLQPLAPPQYIGQIARVAYTAEYIFYRAHE